ncbi:uncharacterized protein DS421_19g656880 [Arachis hypogaea]|uniref:Uncharacterized protein n=1 Tax=Arachis hypogaea TaxID=3818 RepID=A0A6B9VA53_ARAHY|nr:uncharacterized protein DS421_19g656880 [Arachis hypogaea]
MTEFALGVRRTKSNNCIREENLVSHYFNIEVLYLLLACLSNIEDASSSEKRNVSLF